VIVVAAASGTSADAIDVALVDLNLDHDDLSLELLAARTVPWPEGLRDDVLSLLPPATTTAQQVCELDQRLGQAIAEAVAHVVETAPTRPDLVVSPGQTVYHDVRDGRCLGTLQLGQPAWIAERTGLPVMSDLRARDVAAGGHGAPLTSTLDALWLGEPGGPRAALNLGGIANVTIVSGPGEPVTAWDTGPANCLIDVAVASATGGTQTFDRDGALARSGAVRDDLLDVLLAHPHFRRRPPVSTGREVFSADFLDTSLALVRTPVAPADLVATVTELTAVTVANALATDPVTEVIASGGGIRNSTLMGSLRRRLGGVPLVTSDDRGLPADSKEVVMWALLGFLGWHGAAGTNGATGAAHPRILGRISPGHEPLRLPEALSTPVRRLRVVQVSRPGRQPSPGS
jgi:anhydro-N-acetylmuramic acid kinase